MPGDITDPTAVSRQVAAMLRSEILAGTRRPGSELPSQKTLAEQYGYSEATMNRALNELASDGLIRMSSGRRTVVLPQYRYRVLVTLPRGEDITAEIAQGAAERAEARAEVLPAVSSVQLRLAVESIAFEAVVVAADPARAAVTALVVLVQPPGVPLDLSQARIEAEPVA